MYHQLLTGKLSNLLKKQQQFKWQRDQKAPKRKEGRRKDCQYEEISKGRLFLKSDVFCWKRKSAEIPTGLQPNIGAQAYYTTAS